MLNYQRVIKKSVRTGQAQLNGVKSDDGAAPLGKLTGRMGLFWCGLMLAVWVFRFTTLLAPLTPQGVKTTMYLAHVLDVFSPCIPMFSPILTVFREASVSMTFQPLGLHAEAGSQTAS